MDYLQRFIGYSLTGVVREHALLFIHGPGGNGKSVFANVVGRILKDYATVASFDTFTESKGDRHSAEIATLAGARLVSASEPEKGGLGRVQGQAHHRRRRNLGAVHALQSVYVPAAVQALVHRER